MTSKKTWEYLLEKIKEKGTIHFSLIDPDPLKITPEVASKIASAVDDAGSDAILLGGSTAFGIGREVAKQIKEVTSIPLILFPGDLSNHVIPEADAVLFLSVLNSMNPYFIVGVQVQGAMVARSINIETIPTAYLIVEPGGTAGHVAQANLLPRNKPKLGGAYALAAETLGFKMVYFEAGSGVGQPLDPKYIAIVRKMTSLPIIVGGGLKTAEDLIKMKKAGASIVVQGNILEELVMNNKLEDLKKMIKTFSMA